MLKLANRDKTRDFASLELFPGREVARQSIVRMPRETLQKVGDEEIEATEESIATPPIVVPGRLRSWQIPAKPRLCKLL